MNNKLKIVVLSAFYEPQVVGGAEKMVKEVVERLGQKHNITMVTGLFDKSVPRKEARPAFNIVRVGIGHKEIDKFLYPILAAFKVRAIKPQIAHAIMESFAGVALILVKYFTPRVKRILTLQSGDLDDPNKQKQPKVNILWKRIHTAPHIVNAISQFLAERARKLGVPDKRIRITPNGLDFSEVDDTIETIPRRVLNMGRLSWEKGQDYLIRAWPMVLKAVPDAKLIIVGEGEEEQHLRQIILEKGIGNSVEIKKMMPHKQAMREIKKAEVFIAPSLAEGLGMVFFEAQACGVPPIGTNVGGIGEVIENEVNGLLIEPKNEENIAKAIIRLLIDRELWTHLRDKGLETSQRFEWQRIIDDIEGIYFELVGSG